MNWYIESVTAHPILAAVIQFAILGTLGETVSKWMIKKKIHMPFTTLEVLWKMVVWSILAVCIKYAFVGIKGFLHSLTDHTPAMLPAIFKSGVPKAFAISFLINIQFGLFLVIFHRVLDNLILKEKNWQGLHKGMLSLLWFWIPAHTITFSLAKPYQIGLAAVWSVALGIILGMFNRKK